MRCLPLHLIAVFLLSGCASMISTGDQEIAIRSEPAGAEVWVDGLRRGVTPMMLELDRQSDDRKLSLQKSGYETYETVLDSAFNGVVLGNILLGGIIGLAVDGMTGAFWRYDVDSIDAELKPGNGQMVVAPNSTLPQQYVGTTPPANPATDEGKTYTPRQVPRNAAIDDDYIARQRAYVESNTDAIRQELEKGYPGDVLGMMLVSFNVPVAEIPQNIQVLSAISDQHPSDSSFVDAVMDHYY